MSNSSSLQHLQCQKPRKGAEMSSLLLASAVGYIGNCKLPLLLTAAISCSLLILLSRLRNRLKSPTQWWGVIGLCSGSFLGTAALMIGEMQQGSAGASLHSPQERLAFVALLGLAGVFSGRRVGIDPDACGRTLGWRSAQVAQWNLLRVVRPSGFDRLRFQRA